MSEITVARLRRGFVPIYRRLTRCGKEISLHGKAVLWHLLERLGQSSKAWPAQTAIAADLDISERAVRDAVRELEALGFVASERRGQGKTNVMVLRLDKLLDWAEFRAAQNAHLERHVVPLKNGNARRSLHNEETEIEAHRKDRQKSSYPRSDDSDKDRPPDARVERWLVKEMSDHFGARVVQRQLERCESFFVWRKVKQFVDDGHKGALKQLLPQAMAEYQAEIDQITPEPDATPHEEQTLAIYQDIEAKRQAQYVAEYLAWEQETYPVVNGAQ